MRNFLNQQKNSNSSQLLVQYYFTSIHKVPSLIKQLIMEIRQLEFSCVIIDRSEPMTHAGCFTLQRLLEILML